MGDTATENGQIADHNPRVGGSSPSSATIMEIPKPLSSLERLCRALLRVPVYRHDWWLVTRNQGS